MSITSAKWIACGGMVRSGSTLHYHMVRKIVEPYNMLDLGWLIHQKFDGAYMANAYHGGFVVFKTHVPTHHYSQIGRKLIDSGDMVAIRIYRDVRDVAASMIDFWQQFSWAQIVDEVRLAIERHRIWEEIDNIYLVKYEDVVVDLEKEVVSLSNYLNVSSDNAASIAEELSIDNMRRLVPKEEWDEKTTMHPNHINDGAIGKWKHKLTEAQIADIMLVAEGWLQKAGYI